MSQKRRVERLEHATGPDGGHHNVIVTINWDEDDGLTTTYLVDGVEARRADVPPMAAGTMSVIVDWSVPSELDAGALVDDVTAGIEAGDGVKRIQVEYTDDWRPNMTS